eukprot:scaffold991_cov128-Cylindrotheca_fusiformis.AAC.30
MSQVCDAQEMGGKFLATAGEALRGIYTNHHRIVRKQQNTNNNTLCTYVILTANSTPQSYPWVRLLGRRKEDSSPLHHDSFQDSSIMHSPVDSFDLKTSQTSRRYSQAKLVKAQEVKACKRSVENPSKLHAYWRGVLFNLGPHMKK